MKIQYGLFSVALFVLAGCVTPFVIACRDAGMDPQAEWKYTERRAGVACDRAQFYAYPNLVNYHKEKSTWELNPNGVLTSDLELVLRDQAKSLDIWLSYRNRNDADFVDWFPGFRPGLEKQEAITFFLLRRLGLVKTYNEFSDAVGELPFEFQPKEISYLFPGGRKFYSMRILYPGVSLANVPFTAEYLETAKRDGTLKLVDTFETSSSQEYARRVPDLYDPNEFSWKNDARGWAIKSYKIFPDKDKPADNIVHYIEIYRKKKDFSGFETIPAARGFLAAGGSRVSLFVVDYDREGKPGYGSPDEMVRPWLSNITTGKDIFFDIFLRERILDALYDHPQNNIEERPHRQKPRDREIYTQIVKMGEAKLDVWEKGNWTVPLDHKALEQSLDIEYSKPRTPEEQRFEEREKVKKISLFVREYKSGWSKVIIEYWLPKSEYASRNIAQANSSSDTIRLRRKGGQEEVGEINYFASYRKAVDYFYGGKWFRIMDEDGDGVFEKRRQIASPLERPNMSVTESAVVDGAGEELEELGY